MKTNFSHSFIALALLSLATVNLGTAHAQGTAFTYQGRLNNNDVPANGSYDLTFTLYNTNQTGIAVAGPMTNTAVVVTNGLFTTLVDFGANAFTGTSNWLEIAVSPNGANSFTVLSPRQQVTPLPFALTAENLSSVANNNVPPTGAFGSIGGGQNNLNNADYATISGGQTNTIQSNATGSFIGGGDLNNIGAGVIRGSIVGGRQNVIMAGASDGFIGGGSLNIIQTNGEFATIGGGSDNNNGGYASVIAGGEDNIIRIEADDSVISGGDNNLIIGSELQSVYSTIGGGLHNQVLTNATYATIGGGFQNIIQPNVTGSTIDGGQQNTIQSNANYSAIGGGDENTVQTAAYKSVIAGGEANVIETNSIYSTISGGWENIIQPNAGFSAIGGGVANVIQTNAYQSVIGGGGDNAILVNASYSSIGGGAQNTNSGAFSSIPGGLNNMAAGNYSFAAGQDAKALNDGTFVWADTQAVPFSSTANNQFLIRAADGVGINMNNPNGASLYVQGNRSGGTFSSAVGFFENTSTATGSAGSGPALRVVCDGGSTPAGALSVSDNGTGDIADFGNGLQFVAFIQNDGTITNKGNIETAGNVYAHGLLLSSDRNAKQNFTVLDGKQVLAKVVALPLTEWNYKNDAAGTRHIGPMAQDFHAAFDLNGADDKHISVVDEGGVAIAAIQGLNQKLNEKDAEIKNLEKKLDELQATVKQLAAKK